MIGVKCLEQVLLAFSAVVIPVLWQVLITCPVLPRRTVGMPGSCGCCKCDTQLVLLGGPPRGSSAFLAVPQPQYGSWDFQERLRRLWSLQTPSWDLAPSP